MRKYVLGLMTLLIVLFCIGRVIAATDLWNIGSWKVDSTGALIPSSTGSMRAIYENVATGETVLVADSGKTFVTIPATASQSSTFTLPASAVGLEYTFVMGTVGLISVDPATTGDTILYVGLHAGDRITSPAATGDSVTLICPVAGSWAVKAMFGTWTDGGA
jgi:hypothetical protein